MRRGWVALGLLAACAAPPRREGPSLRELRELAVGVVRIEELASAPAHGLPMVFARDTDAPDVVHIGYVRLRPGAIGIHIEPQVLLETRGGVLNGYLFIAEPTPIERQLVSELASYHEPELDGAALEARLGPAHGRFRCPSSYHPGCPAGASMAVWTCSLEDGRWRVLAAELTDGAPARLDLLELGFRDDGYVSAFGDLFAATMELVRHPDVVLHPAGEPSCR